MSYSVSAQMIRPHPLLLLPGWIAAFLVVGCALALGLAGGSVARPSFIFGCIVVSIYAWLQSPASHLQTLLVLFCFAPFARRVVDLHAGFDGTGIMLVGPLLALLAPVPRLLTLLDGRSTLFSGGRVPLLVVACCVAYAGIIAVFRGAFVDAASSLIKWGAPLAYAAVLIETGERRKLTDAATNIFLVLLPLTGLYGLFQYIDPPEWDRFWMRYATAITAGLPLPYEIRVYATLNGPASFATFTTVGILLVAVLRPIWLSLIVCAPAALALLLSQYRTAWLSLALALLFCMWFGRTRGRAGLIILAMVFGGMFALAIPGFSDALVERLETFGQGSQDGSLQERLEQYGFLWSQPDSSLFGSGFSAGGDAGVAGTVPVDGMLIACWLTMGIVVGQICIFGFVWACGRTMVNAWASGQKDAVALGALGCGALLQIPLANLGSSELGFLFWSFAAIACLPDLPYRNSER